MPVPGADTVLPYYNTQSDARRCAVYSWLNSTAVCAPSLAVGSRISKAANLHSMIRSEGGEVLLAPVSFADVRRISHVFNSAFSREPGSAYLYSYPPEGTAAWQLAVASTLRYRTALMRRILCDPRQHVIAASIGGDMAGFSVWTPPGRETSLRRPVPLRYRLLGAIYTIYDKLVSLFIPAWVRRLFASRATVEYLRRSGLMNAGDSIGLDDAIPAYIAARGYWTLMILGVSEQFERRGIGSRLLQWGCDQADRTDRAVLVVASPEGEQLYGRRGFVKVGFNVMLEKKEAEGMTQTYMIRFPASQREKNR